MGTSADKLSWVDGIVDLFSDRAWAGQELDALAEGVQGDELATVKQLRKRRAAA